MNQCCIYSSFIVRTLFMIINNTNIYIVNFFYFFLVVSCRIFIGNLLWVMCYQRPNFGLRERLVFAETWFNIICILYIIELNSLNLYNLASVFFVVGDLVYCWKTCNRKFTFTNQVQKSLDMNASRKTKQRLGLKSDMSFNVKPSSDGQVWLKSLFL